MSGSSLLVDVWACPDRVRRVCRALDATSASALWLCAAALRCCRVCACAVRVLCDVCMRCAPAK
jgi:hypothetical protein